jgi:hypothetical protein
VPGCALAPEPDVAAEGHLAALPLAFNTRRTDAFTPECASGTTSSTPQSARSVKPFSNAAQPSSSPSLQPDPDADFLVHRSAPGRSGSRRAGGHELPELRVHRRAELGDLTRRHAIDADSASAVSILRVLTPAMAIISAVVRIGSSAPAANSTSLLAVKPVISAQDLTEPFPQTRSRDIPPWTLRNLRGFVRGTVHSTE